MDRELGQYFIVRGEILEFQKSQTSAEVFAKDTLASREQENGRTVRLCPSKYQLPK
jgi:hypothetical protein